MRDGILGVPMIGRQIFWAVMAALAGLAAAPSDGLAKPGRQTFLGQFGAWYAYQLAESGARICYMVSKPVRSRGKYKKRGDVVAFITHRPRDGERDVVNFQAGYTYKPGAKVTARIDKEKTYRLMADRDAAWSKNAAADEILVELLPDAMSEVFESDISLECEVAIDFATGQGIPPIKGDAIKDSPRPKLVVDNDPPKDKP